MLTQYQEARREVRAGVLEVVQILMEVNREALKSIELLDASRLQNLRKRLKPINKKTEVIDNKLVVIFARYTPEARDLREMVAYLKITSGLNRIKASMNSYIKNMQGMLAEDDAAILRFTKESLSINRCTIHALEKTAEMLQTFDDHEKIRNLATEIDVEYAKTDDIYALLEKSVVQRMHESDGKTEEYFSLLKYIRKNLKIIDRLDSVAQRIIFARMGGKL